MELERLQKEIIVLRRYKKIHDAQNKLFETFINMARSSTEEEVLNVTMKDALEIATRFSGAEKGSLFLLDKNGVVTDRSLTQDQTGVESPNSLIGKIIDKGLAGWVKDTLSIGLVTDATTDDRWLTLPGQSYTVRSALAVPVIRNDTLFGIITLIHSLPSQFNQTTVNIVQQTANHLALAIENAKLYEKLEQSNRSLEKAKQAVEKYSRALDDELERGKKIQKDFLPLFPPKVKNCEISFYFHAALQLSGDFYDVFEMPNHHMGFVVADVSGKGVGASLFMALTRSLLRIFSRSIAPGERPGDLNDASIAGDVPGNALKAVSLTNEYLAREHGKDGIFVTLLFCVIDQLTGKLYYVNGGHEPAFLIGKTGIKKVLHATGPALCPVRGAEYKIETEQLDPGDLLFGFTDGVTEARSKTREFYTREKIEALIQNGIDDSAEALLETIKSDLFAFIGEADQSDDITMLAVRWSNYE
jgi:sigma-B regulation protein RsbU (phosphoserine phosphatase)